MSEFSENSDVKKVSELMDGRVSTFDLVKEVWRCAPEFRWFVTQGLMIALVAKLATAACALIIASAVDYQVVSSVSGWTFAGWSVVGLSCAFAVAKITEALLAPIQMLISQKAEGYAESRVLDKAFAGLLALPHSSWSGVDMSEATARVDVKSSLKCLFFVYGASYVPLF